jgi:glutathione peroxidase
MRVSLVSVFDAPVKTLHGASASLSDHQGEALLIVNVASKCGYTRQYAQLEELQPRYSGRGFTVLGFPCNQFGAQEPGTPDGKAGDITWNFEKFVVSPQGKIVARFRSKVAPNAPEVVAAIEAQLPAR